MLLERVVAEAVSQRWVLDVNTLIYAFLPSSTFHSACSSWLKSALESQDRVYLPTICKMPFLRLCGAGAVVNPPVPFDVLHDYLDNLKKLGVEEVGAGTHHDMFWRICCESIAAKGNDITDSHIAATNLELNGVLVSADKGFKRFKGPKVFDPTVSNSK